MSVESINSEQFEKYLKGHMSQAEKHAFERALLDDPFAMEALEGLESQEVSQISDDLKRLRNQVEIQKKSTYPWLKMAAAISFILISSALIFYLTDRVDSTQLTLEEVTKESNLSASDTSNFPSANKDQETLAENIAEETKAESTEGEAKVEFKKDDVQVELEDAQIMEKSSAVNTQKENVASMPSEKKNLPAEIASRNKEQVPITESIEEVAPAFETAILAEQKMDKQIEMDAQKTQMTMASNLTENENVSARKISIQSAKISNTNEENMNTVTGTITDDSGEPLPGVNVVIKGTTNGVTSDLDGHYQLPKVDDMTLVYSFVGFESQEVAVGNRTNIDMTISGSVELQEVVVTGASEIEKNTYSGAKPHIGLKAYKKYLEKQLIYPKAATENKIEGTVILELSISPTGNIQSIDVKKSLGFGCDDEAIRLVREGSKWNPATQNGLAVASTVRVKVKFKLD